MATAVQHSNNNWSWKKKPGGTGKLYYNGDVNFEMGGTGEAEK